MKTCYEVYSDGKAPFPETLNDWRSFYCDQKSLSDQVRECAKGSQREEEEFDVKAKVIE